MSSTLCAYVYDLDRLEQEARNMVKLLPKDTNLFYAIKANPDERILGALLPYVSGFEVASIGELKKVRKVSADVPVLFGGPSKKEYELRGALRAGVTYIHIESTLELQRLLLIANELQTSAQVLLRINLNYDDLPTTNVTMAGEPSPFGMEETEIERALKLVAHQNLVQIYGFHFHSISNNLREDLHVAMIDHYVDKVEEWQSTYGLDVKVLNCGGGFGVSYDENPSFDWEKFIAALKSSGVLDRVKGKQLFFEPGRRIVANCGYYVTEVNDLKQSQQEHFAILRGGTHHQRLPASWGHNHPFKIIPIEEWPYPFSRPTVTEERVNIVGELCSPKDRLHSQAEVTQLRVGDLVVFLQSGAYSWTISHHQFLGHDQPAFLYYRDKQFQSISRSDH
ncbi:type III PLP-dependent enzyme [Geomicrobium sp. JCM 19038]|uniref:type III PLP-dependent enzyme n=1 Tax=Geomicrobium sp. JCM 19038 TaxID=1460635 RepID=UPI001EE66253|nr:type III PLP-dependent enzyme [Geomicrobium sp. JCM 19038]